MVYGGGAAAAAAAVAMAQAIKASGAIVQVTTDNFLTILSKTDRPLVVIAQGGTFKKNYQYLSAYKGLIFYTKSDSPLNLPQVELIAAKQIWIPH